MRTAAGTDDGMAKAAVRPLGASPAPPGPGARVKASSGALGVVVLGDLMVDVAFAPNRPLEAGTDVPGRVTVRAGGSAANTARWLGRLGLPVTLIAAVGRDQAGLALEAAVRADGVLPRLVRVGAIRTGRIGVVVTPGERSFVADRGAADRLGPEDVRAAWFAGAVLLHLPGYSLLGPSLGPAAFRAIELARARRALVSVDLASVAPLLARGRAAARRLVRDVAPDILFATSAEAAAILGLSADDRGDLAPPGLAELVGFAPIAVIKRGRRGAMVVARDPGSVGSHLLQVQVAGSEVEAADTTGAGDAFDAGFIAALLAGDPALVRGPARPRRAGGRSGRLPDGPSPRRFDVRSLRRAALAGQRAARRQLVARQVELPLL